MKVFIPGIDGYIGWALAMHLARKGHHVVGIDNFSRRKNVSEVGSQSATEILSIEERIKLFERQFGKNIEFIEGDLLNYDLLDNVMRSFQPDAIVHLGEQPSAPYSMIDRRHAIYTQENNVIGTLNLLYAIKDHVPNCHLVKLGTMGEYGTPNVDIPEGFFQLEYKGRKDWLPFPRMPGSLYHLSKVHDSHNIHFACRIWGLRSTDVMQGVVYGVRTSSEIPEELYTRFDFDEVFGTAINRFCAQAVCGHPLTPYGKGMQKRGFIALVDSIQCLTLAVENPPQQGEYRVFNQIDEVYSIFELAEKVKKVAGKFGIDVQIGNIANPRVESEEHYYRVESEKLRQLGFRPTRTIETELEIMLTTLLKFKNRIEMVRHVIMPKTTWKNGLVEKSARAPN